MSHVLLLQNDARTIPLKDRSVHMICTSPPYFALRDYGVANQLGLEDHMDCQGWATGQDCGRCYLCVLRQVFRECWRVLRNDGTLFCNIGDSYNAAGRTGHGTRHGYKQDTNRASATGQDHYRPSSVTLKPKDLCGIPQRLALALQADGWIWRSEIIWHKVNPMPESVQDRPTKAHEQVLLFAKQGKYFWDAEAVREEAVYGRRINFRSLSYENNNAFHNSDRQVSNGANLSRDDRPEAGRACRDVWSLPSEPVPFAHFACMPTALVAKCIQAGAPLSVCSVCGAPWVRQVERGGHTGGRADATVYSGQAYAHAQSAPRGPRKDFGQPHTTTTGFLPSCPCTVCPVHDFHSGFCVGPCPHLQTPTPVPSLVFDPFAGSGTVPLVARALGRHGIGGDLSLPYLYIARERVGLTALAAWQGEAQPAVPCETADLPLFLQGGG